MEPLAGNLVNKYSHSAIVQHFTKDFCCGISYDDFQEFRVLGRGGFGMVFAVRRKSSGVMFASKEQCKLRIKAGKAAESCLVERNALCAVDSPFVVEIHYALQDDLNFYLMLELLAGGDLGYHLGKEGTFNEDITRYFLGCTLMGIGAIHDAGYVYRDLKPQNILMSEKGHCKISDLGLAAKVEGKGLKGSAGTRGYWAPEMVRQKQKLKGTEATGAGPGGW